MTQKLIKCGFDPTTAELHLGHTVVLKKLKEYQDQGHLIKIIFGTFTATIGDSTGKDKTRPILDIKDVIKNCNTYEDQILKVLNKNNLKFYYNSSWLSSLRLDIFLDYFTKITVSQILARDNFKIRMNNNQPITLSELMYPILQGYDSSFLKADIEVGGTDQLFNMMMGRTIQQIDNVPPQEVVTVPLLIGTDGVHKMSKSLGNHISLNDNPQTK